MEQCDRCGESVAVGGEWIEVNHHHPHMTFGSRFCSADCAVAYLEDALVDEGGNEEDQGSDEVGV